MLVYTQKGDKAFNLDKVISVNVDYYAHHSTYEVAVIFNRSLKDNYLLVYAGNQKQCQHILTWLVGKSKNPNYGTGDELRSDYLTFYE